MNKTNKKSVHKSKSKKSPLNTNEIYKIAEKEIENSKKLSETEKLLTIIYKEIKNATKEYQQKLLNICSKLKPDENTFDGKIQKIISDILQDISNNINFIMKKINENKDDISYENNDITQKAEELEESLIDKIQNYDENKKLYEKEINHYEAYLINKELGLLKKDKDGKDINGSKENKKDKKEKDKDKDKKSESALYDNHEQLYEKQELYISSKNELKMNLNIIFVAINTKKKLFFKSLKANCDNFTKYIKIGLTKINQALELKIDFIKKNMDINSNIISEGDLINQLITDDYNTFKFIIYDQNKEAKEESDTKDNSKNKKKKKDKDKNELNEDINSDELYNQLEDKNIQNMINEAQNHKIGLSKLSKDKLVLIENKKYIVSIVELIIKNPDKYDNETKEKFVQMISSEIEYQKTFLRYLNNYRTTNQLCMKKITVTILCDLFKIIIDLAIKNDDYGIISYSFILTLTYYHLKDEENNDNKINTNDDEDKIYMTEYLKQNESLKQMPFWLKLLESLINDEMAKLNKKKIITESQKSFAVYSSIITLIKDMIDYDCEESFILKIIEEIYTKYPDISVELKAEILNFTSTEINEREKNKK